MEMSDKDELSIRYMNIARHPIAEHNYAGDDIRYSTAFEQLESELGGAQSVLKPLSIDWSRIRERSEQILISQSKDLRVASWLAWALYECESFPGLLAGLRLIHYLCDQHWQTLFPEKPRTRSAAIGWLIIRLDKLLVEDISISRQLPVFQEMINYLDSLDELFGRYLVDESVLLLPLRRRLTRMIQRALQVEKTPVTVVQQVKQVATQLFSSPAKIDCEKDAERTLSQYEHSVKSLCKWWLGKKTTDPRAFRLARTLVWLSVDKLPVSNAQKITQQKGLPVDRLKNYQARFEQGLFADLIVDVEASLATSPFWFDGQYLIWSCLNALGDDAAKQEVEAQFAVLLKRIPEVVQLYFSDGTPFANAQTLQWISAQIVPPVPPVQRTFDIDSRQSSPEWDSAYEELLPTLQDNGLKAVVQVLTQRMSDAKGGREMFFWKLCLARMCYQAKKYELASIQLEFLDRELQTSGLDAWEPLIFLDVLRLLHNCYEQIPQNSKSALRKEEVYQRLCHYDLEGLIA
ncbi:ImpA domain protein [Pseudomonas syringae pv. tagetis]|uniref:ImpA domain protein n=2 Tax=Pseudomonas syringae pv. tagetis TaxID=129140 RepID=A0A0Q0AZ62_9PSED|nr:ImpA domain protein [Pseudomonas syringae pv. tagetis]RMW16826.1 ImpA domain protein [Pseudomonas syringae pv. tagetis]RMW17788.1 ImpA domain protein [Pseudomonas syringae pv. tagetis]